MSLYSFELKIVYFHWNSVKPILNLLLENAENQLSNDNLNFNQDLVLCEEELTGIINRDSSTTQHVTYFSFLRV